MFENWKTGQWFQAAPFAVPLFVWIVNSAVGYRRSRTSPANLQLATVGGAPAVPRPVGWRLQASIDPWRRFTLVVALVLAGIGLLCARQGAASRLQTAQAERSLHAAGITFYDINVREGFIKREELGCWVKSPIKNAGNGNWVIDTDLKPVVQVKVVIDGSKLACTAEELDAPQSSNN